MQRVRRQGNSLAFAHSDGADKGKGPGDAERTPKVAHGRDGSVHAGDVEDGADFLDSFALLANKPTSHTLELELCCREGLGAEFVLETLDGDTVEFGAVSAFARVGD